MGGPVVRVTVDGRSAPTLEEIAEQAGISYEAARKLVSRAGIEPLARVGNVYDPDQVAAALTRPGRGAPGVSRPHRPPAA